MWLCAYHLVLVSMEIEWTTQFRFSSTVSEQLWFKLQGRKTVQREVNSYRSERKEGGKLDLRAVSLSIWMACWLRFLSTPHKNQCWNHADDIFPLLPGGFFSLVLLEKYEGGCANPSSFSKHLQPPRTQQFVVECVYNSYRHCLGYSRKTNVCRRKTLSSRWCFSLTSSA